MSESPVRFLGRAGPAIREGKATATESAARLITDLRLAAVERYPAMDAMRDRARAIRQHTLANLDSYLGQFADALEAAGGHVHFAADAAEATAIVVELAAAHDVRLAIKSKSMVTEEIELNHALEANGVEVVETDLGEFIAQLAGEAPSHIIAPVLHKTRQEIGQVFTDRLGTEYTDDPQRLNDVARAHLRRIFLQAGMGISGVNMAVAATGAITTVTNEGNGRLTTTAPRVHVAMMGMERIVPDLGSLGVILEVLARSATGQNLSVYTNIVTGPRRPDDPDGPDELHVVVLDNGRSRALAGETAEILGCIRCGACLNVCPVYRAVGGHAYGSVYPGPVGSIITPAMLGRHDDLPFASTLCGACQDVCPIRIDIPRMLLLLRTEAEERPLPRALAAYASAATHPAAWRALLRSGGLAGRIAGRDGWIGKAPGPGAGWTAHRDLPAPAAESFHRWWKKRQRKAGRDGT